MKRALLLVPAFAVALLGSTKIAKAQEYYGPRQYYYEQHEAERAWERQGFYDGVRGADRDFENGRRPDVNNRHEYRDPYLPRWERHEYREGFRRGYYERVKQIYMVGDGEMTTMISGLSRIISGWAVTRSGLEALLTKSSVFSNGKPRKPGHLGADKLWDGLDVGS